MDFSHEGQNKWSSISDEVLGRSYGEHGEYNLEQLKTDIWNEGFILKVRDLEEDLGQVYEQLESYAEQKGFVTGKEIEDSLNEYFEQL